MTAHAVPTVDLSAIRALNDLQLALLVCLLAPGHCIVRAPAATLAHVAAEIAIACSKTFNFTAAHFECHPNTSLEDFADQVLVATPDEDTGLLDPREVEVVRRRRTKDTDAALSDARESVNVLDNRLVANVLVVRGLEKCGRTLQIQVLELLRTKHILSRSGVHATPKSFVFIALLPSDDPAHANPPFLTPHLNDAFLLSHNHTLTTSLNDATISPKTLSDLTTLTSLVRIHPRVRTYARDIPAFLRLHRRVRAASVSALSTRHVAAVARALAPLHGLAFVAPGLVQLAARKVYAHRVELVRDIRDARTVQWAAGGGFGRGVVADKGLGIGGVQHDREVSRGSGSLVLRAIAAEESLVAEEVRAVRSGEVDVAMVLEEVLELVECPL